MLGRPASQPQSSGGVPAGLDLQLIVTEALIGMIAAVTSTSPPTNEPPPPFIQAGIDRAVSRISAHLAPLQAEIESKGEELAKYIAKANDFASKMLGAQSERDQLKARCDELEAGLRIIATAGTKTRAPDLRLKAKQTLNRALSKPAGSEQV